MFSRLSQLDPCIYNSVKSKIAKYTTTLLKKKFYNEACGFQIIECDEEF